MAVTRSQDSRGLRDRAVCLGYCFVAVQVILVSPAHGATDGMAVQVAVPDAVGGVDDLKANVILTVVGEVWEVYRETPGPFCIAAGASTPSCSQPAWSSRYASVRPVTEPL